MPKRPIREGDSVIAGPISMWFSPHYVAKVKDGFIWLFTEDSENRRWAYHYTRGVVTFAGTWWDV